jgi:phosphate transport system substrate-binding protein
MLTCSRLLTLFFFFLSAAPSLAQEKITVCGTGDSQRLLQALADSFGDSQTEISVEVPNSIGSSGGIRKTAEGLCDLGRVARPLKEREGKYNLHYKLFASSPLVFIVHENVSIQDLTAEQVLAVLSGKIQNWQELGGPDMKIFIAKREKGDSSRRVLENNIPQLNEATDLAGQTTFSTSETLEAVSQYKGTLSYAPLAMTDFPGVRVLTYNGVTPTPENARAGSYPLNIPFGFVWKGELSHASKKFIEFIESPKGEKILLQHGAIPAQ